MFLLFSWKIGQQSLRTAWSTYYTNTEVFFVISLFLFTILFFWPLVRNWNWAGFCRVICLLFFDIQKTRFNILRYTEKMPYIPHKLWVTNFHNYLALNFQFIIMVIDSTDRERLAVTREELYTLLQHEDLSKACLLVYANKQVSFFYQSELLTYSPKIISAFFCFINN